jgi:hypothetical protein
MDEITFKSLINKFKKENTSSQAIISLKERFQREIFV